MTKYRKIGDSHWIVEVQEDGKTKDLFITLPPDALSQVGWDVGDTVVWEELNDGAWSIKKKETNES